jgi:hypothetical protein
MRQEMCVASVLAIAILLLAYVLVYVKIRSNALARTLRENAEGVTLTEEAWMSGRTTYSENLARVVFFPAVYLDRKFCGFPPYAAEALFGLE